ncbi:MAG: rhodanese-like domain-containing protein [Pseudomonadota bacterium]
MAGKTAGIEQLTPPEAWSALQDGGALVDVRTRPEWTFVGLPDLAPLGQQPILIEWKTWPVMAANPGFVDEVMATLGDAAPQRLLFLCRSGARSQDAALAVQAAFDAGGVASACCNVAEGFEGDLASDGRRGSLNGWKARGLPWRQS